MPSSHDGPHDPTTRQRRVLLQRLESLHRAGVQQLGRAPVRVDDHVDSNGDSPQAALTAEGNTDLIDKSTKMVSGDSVPADRSQSLRILAEKVAGCSRCDELSAKRTQTVFGVGDPHARLCFFGEAPGADEDRLGEPFVGRAGQLLTKIIEAMTLRREDVYILNTLKCRPPGNRNPLPAEVENCWPFFEQQLEIIQPEFLCCLGAVSAGNLLQTKTPIGQLRGRFHDWKGIKVLATYHPAYLLRNPSMKKCVWEDMQLLMAAMGLEVPPPKK